MAFCAPRTPNPFPCKFEIFYFFKKVLAFSKSSLNFRLFFTSFWGRTSVLLERKHVAKQKIRLRRGNFSKSLNPVLCLNRVRLSGCESKLDFDWRMLHQHDVGGEGGRRANPVAMSAVWPGFDDSRVPFSWNHGNPRLIPRNVAAGNTLEATFDLVLQHHRAGSNETMLDRSYLQVVTFNDWPEGTAIEPDNSSDPYGA